MEEWIAQLDLAFAEDANVPVTLKRLLRENDVFALNDDALELLLRRLLKANLTYDLELQVQVVSTELERRTHRREYESNRRLATIAIGISIFSAIVQLIEAYGHCP